MSTGSVRKSATRISGWSDLLKQPIGRTAARIKPTKARNFFMRVSLVLIKTNGPMRFANLTKKPSPLGRGFDGYIGGLPYERHQGDGQGEGCLRFLNPPSSCPSPVQ